MCGQMHVMYSEVMWVFLSRHRPLREVDQLSLEKFVGLKDGRSQERSENITAKPLALLHQAPNLLNIQVACSSAHNCSRTEDVFCGKSAACNHQFFLLSCGSR